MLVLAIARSDEYLASLAYRIREADVDPAVKGAVLTIATSRRPPPPSSPQPARGRGRC
ncbi:MAG: hypothetical protein ACRDPJ_20685 [Nocardioidaceae bacterium]